MLDALHILAALVIIGGFSFMAGWVVGAVWKTYH